MKKQLPHEMPSGVRVVAMHGPSEGAPFLAPLFGAWTLRFEGRPGRSLVEFTVPVQIRHYELGRAFRYGDLTEALMAVSPSFKLTEEATIATCRRKVSEHGEVSVSLVPRAENERIKIQELLEFEQGRGGLEFGDTHIEAHGVIGYDHGFVRRLMHNSGWATPPFWIEALGWRVGRQVMQPRSGGKVQRCLHYLLWTCHLKLARRGASGWGRARECEELERLEDAPLCRYGQECIHVHLDYEFVARLDSSGSRQKTRGLMALAVFLEERASTIEHYGQELAKFAKRVREEQDEEAEQEFRRKLHGEAVHQDWIRVGPAEDPEPEVPAVEDEPMEVSQPEANQS